MALDVEMKPSAAKALRALPQVDQERIRRKLTAFAESPESDHHDVLPLVGKPQRFRLRVGDWRVIFVRSGSMIDVQKIAHRREVYR